MIRTAEQASRSDFSSLSFPRLRAAAAGALVGISGAGAIPQAHGQVENRPNATEAVTQIARQATQEPSGPLPVEYGVRIEGFGPLGDRALRIFERQDKKFPEPPFCFIPRKDSAKIEFLGEVPSHVRDLLRSEEYNRIVSLSYEGETPWTTAGGPSGKVRTGYDVVIRFDQEERRLAARAYYAQQVNSGKFASTDPSLWIPQEVTDVRCVLINGTNLEVLGVAQSLPVDGARRTRLLFEQSPDQFSKSLVAETNGTLMILPLYAARGELKTSEGSLRQTGTRNAEVLEKIKTELGKVGRDGKVSLNDARGLEARIRTLIQIEIETSDQNLLSTLTALVAPDGFILDILEPVDLDKLSPTDAAVLAAWSAPGVNTYSVSSGSTTSTLSEERLKESYRKKRFWGGGHGHDKETFTSTANTQTKNESDSTTQVSPGQVEGFRINQEKLFTQFEKVANITVKRADTSYYAVPPISTEFDLKMFHKQLENAVQQSTAGLIDTLDKVQVSWIGVEQHGKKNVPQLVTQNLHATHNYGKDASSTPKEPQFIVEGQFEAKPNWQFEGVDEKSVQLSAHIPGDTVKLVSIAPATTADGKPDPSRLKWTVQVSRSQENISSAGGFTVILPNQKIRHDDLQDAKELTQRITAMKDGKADVWSLERRGGAVDISLNSLVLEQINVLPAAKLELDMRVLVPTSKGDSRNEIVLRGSVDLGNMEPTNVGGVMVKYLPPSKPEDKGTLRIWLDR
jgi:hypothetical protein